MTPIRIAVGEISVDGVLNDSDAARALARALPLNADFRVWGDALHVELALDVARHRRPAHAVSVGDLCYGTQDEVLCAFFGPTPLSEAEDPVAAVPVNVIGKIDGATALRRAKEAGRMHIAAAPGS